MSKIYDFETLTREKLLSDGELTCRSYGGWELVSTMCESQDRYVPGSIFGVPGRTIRVTVYHYTFRRGRA